MEQPNTHLKAPARKKEFIDFSKLSFKELDNLAYLWESEARKFELRLSNYMHGANLYPEKTIRLWNVANSLWRRVRTLEIWRIKNDQKHRK